jgi:hypothetical protein
MDARAVVCAVLLSLLCAPAAGAATVKGPIGPGSSTIQFDAERGETNDGTLLGLFGPCPGRVTLELRLNRRWRSVGSASCELPADCGGGFAVTLDARGRRALQRVRWLNARISFTQSPGAGGGALTERHVLQIRRAGERRR